MGDEWETNYLKFCIEDEEDQKMQEQFVKNEAKIKNDFKQKIKNLQDFFA